MGFDQYHEPPDELRGAGCGVRGAGCGVRGAG
jgi:hypothetical protein